MIRCLTPEEQQLVAGGSFLASEPSTEPGPYRGPQAPGAPRDQSPWRASVPRPLRPIVDLFFPERGEGEEEPEEPNPESPPG